MPADLESQLRASLPGRSTEVQDYARLWTARDQIRQAVELIRAARGTVSAVLGESRPAVEHAAAADIEGCKAALDLDRAIKAHPAGKVPR